MIILLTGATHTGKTYIAHLLMKELSISVLSLDHIKMGLIRSGLTALTPTSSLEELTDLIWPVAREIIKTAIENKQSLIVEGCYIPSNFREEFEEEYLKEIHAFVLLFSKEYISNNQDVILENRNIVEHREETMHFDFIEKENANFLKKFQNSDVHKIVLGQKYSIFEIVNQIKKNIL